MEWSSMLLGYMAKSGEKIYYSLALRFPLYFRIKSTVKTLEMSDGVQKTRAKIQLTLK